MNTCFKILGQGAQGVTYLSKLSAEKDVVVKVEPVRKNVLKDGDYFGLEVVPQLPEEVRRHFIKYYSVEFYEENPLLNLVCSSESLSKKIKRFLLSEESSFNNLKFPKVPYYKVTTMEYAGDMTAESVTVRPNILGPNMHRMMFEQLYVPACAINHIGYFHRDMHARNIMFDGKLFKIIDYGLMKRATSSGDPMPDVYNLASSIYWYQTQYMIETKKPLYMDFDSIDGECKDLIDVPEKYKGVSDFYEEIFHMEELIRCRYLNDDIKLIPFHKDKIYDDYTLIELMKVIYNDFVFIDNKGDYKKLAIKIQSVIKNEDVYSNRGP